MNKQVLIDLLLECQTLANGKYNLEDQSKTDYIVGIVVHPDTAEAIFQYLDSKNRMVGHNAPNPMFPTSSSEFGLGGFSAFRQPDPDEIDGVIAMARLAKKVIEKGWKLSALEIDKDYVEYMVGTIDVWSAAPSLYGSIFGGPQSEQIYPFLLDPTAKKNTATPISVYLN